MSENRFPEIEVLGGVWLFVMMRSGPGMIVELHSGEMEWKTYLSIRLLSKRMLW